MVPPAATPIQLYKKAQHPAVSRHIEGHNGHQRQRREKRLHRCQQDGHQRAQILKPGQQALPELQLSQLVEPCPVHHAFILSRLAHSMQLVYPNSMTGL